MALAAHEAFGGHPSPLQGGNKVTNDVTQISVEQFLIENKEEE
jgi:hypothetical protein